MLEQKSATDGWRSEWLEIGEYHMLLLALLSVPMFLPLTSHSNIAGSAISHGMVSPLNVAME